MQQRGSKLLSQYPNVKLKKINFKTFWELECATGVDF